MLGANEPSPGHFEQLTEFLQEYMPDIRVKEQHGDQITYVILDDAEHTRIFPDMLMDLDANKENFRIKSYGLSNSSLEQVFLRVAKETKRVEDYERLSRCRRFRNYLKQCCGKKAADNAATTSTVEAEDEEKEKDDYDETQFTTGLSGKTRN